MKKTYISLLTLVYCAVMFTSCKLHYNLTTSGLPEKDSSYLVKLDNSHIPFKKADVQPDKLFIDGTARYTGDILGVKYKNKYYSIVNGQIYGAEIFGKVNLLYTLEYGIAQGSNGAYHQVVLKNNFLQKQGSNEVVDASKLNFYDYLSDNKISLRRMHGANTWGAIRTGSGISFGVGVVGILGGLIYIANHNGPDRGAMGALAGGGLILSAVSIPTYLTAHIIASHKAKKAIKIYNR